MQSLAEDRHIDTAKLGEEYFGTTRTPSLKRLVASLLGVQIQGSEHSSVRAVSCVILSELT
jgi:hypothetical protein